MSGKKQDPFKVGKSKNPPGFGKNKLSVRYTANKSAWMIRPIFEDYPSTGDKKLDHEIVLLIDNCTVHTITSPLENIRIVYLTASTTSVLQPFDLGIIKTFKTYSRNEMIKKVSNALEITLVGKANDIAKKATLFDGLHLAASAWDSVADTTIRNGFKEGDFVTTQIKDLALEPEPIEALIKRCRRNCMMTG